MRKHFLGLMLFMLSTSASYCQHVDNTVDPKITLGNITGVTVPYDSLLTNTRLTSSDPINFMIKEYDLAYIIKDDIGFENYYGPYFIKGSKIPDEQLQLLKRNKGRVLKVYIEGIHVITSDNITRLLNPIFLSCVN